MKKWKLRFALFPTRVGISKEGNIKWTWLTFYRVREVSSDWGPFIYERQARNPKPGIMPFEVEVWPL